ncbi:MAG: hypothetical protein J6Y91_03370, partial [Alphaproteobacteria bacterium]|nr:hypothetical protein [Alphaproteobacteria bacterium]
MKVLSKISLLSAIIAFFTATSAADARLVQGDYEEEPVINEVAVDVTTSRGFRFTDNPLRAPTYDPRGPQFVRVREVRADVEKIRIRGTMRCGSNLQVKSFAFQEDGIW